MTVLSRSRPVHLYQMTDGRQTAGSTAGRSPTASTPAQYRNMFHRYQLRTKNHSENMFSEGRSDHTKNPRQKITLLTALKAQKKPATKKHVSRHIKNPQKISIYSRSPRPVGIESANFYHVLKCAFFGDNSARKKTHHKRQFTRHHPSEIYFTVKPAYLPR